MNNDKPKLLDLFCGAGGCSEGYRRAGFDCYGVDNNPKPLRHYPFPYVCMDALEAMETLLRGEGLTFSNGEMLYLAEVDAYHASPPCQAYSVTRFAVAPKERPALLGITRELLIKTYKPWVIENVIGSPTQSHIVLCGVMFGLKTYRHRKFETSLLMMQPEHPKHPERLQRKGRNPSVGGYSNPCGHPNISGEFAIWKESMQIDWMDREEIGQAISPAYTEYIGKYLMPAVKSNEQRSS